ncbi:hypothetical protein B296_00050041 [Ensete ventricosum]|uniref:Uncharacterized protein n=1 Tax=Ensete ventricosum TaxID=4639 RepID=A0A426YF11_ENSVE|nr:hypothetical protein B296_00050041 [Ensete ventricosum]
MLREHDEDSVITKSFLPKIRSSYHIYVEYDLRILEVVQRPFDLFPDRFKMLVDAFKVGMGANKCSVLHRNELQGDEVSAHEVGSEPSLSQIGLIVEASVACEPEHLAKKTKVLVSKKLTHPHAIQSHHT